MKKGMLLFGIIFCILSFSIPNKSVNLLSFIPAKAAIDTSGQTLARSYCSICHVFPEPKLLDKNSWTTGVLPNMGLRLGIREDGIDPYEDLKPEEKEIIQRLHIYPEKPLISKRDWNKIVDYYERMAPDSLPKISLEGVKTGNQFEAQPLYFGDKKSPKTTMLKYDSTANAIYIGEGQNMLYILNGNLSFNSAWYTESPPVDIDFPVGKPVRLLNIGTFNPSDLKKGKLFSFDTSAIGMQRPPQTEISDLYRPVQFATGDLNMDGEEDVVICEFGNNRGELAWFESFDKNKKHVLSYLPGARRAIIQDMNGDGKPDIVVLMAQAREEVVIYYNQGDGIFSEETVLEFPPVYGVNYIDLVDFNHDGHLDILLVNGDNWDYSPVEKYYHGVRIFENDGNNRFEEKFFFPIPGASKAIAVDFDNDGNCDIAIAAFYSNKQKIDHNFIYLENEGDYHFTPYYFPDVKGKWLTMTVGDFNRDGQQDIILGTYIHSSQELTSMVMAGVENFPQVVVLHNKMKEGD